MRPFRVYRALPVPLAVLLVAGCRPSATPVPLPAPAMTAPIIIAHRGASGHRPEHTIEAYALAIEMGADYIEPDLVATKDGVLVARHENEIGGTTDVAAKFPDRRTQKVIDGDTVRGWFTEDFTLAELRTLRAKERLPMRSHAYDGQFVIPTFDDILLLVANESVARQRPIGLYPETKHPSYFRSIGLPLEPPLLEALTKAGYRTKEAPVFIQSFEVGNLRALRSQTPLRLVQLVSPVGAPPDFVAAGDARTYRDLVTPDGLREIARYADGIGANTRMIVPVASDGALGTPTSLVAEAHAAGLVVHAWTLRSESAFLPKGYAGDPLAEVRQLAQLGVDGLFCDFPDVGVRGTRAR
ncbi:MAG: glycerophosphodiester phosphodiesterase [Gemmatimonadaceae bacterium]|nr:glycerophosphodiester phosphodiesterase [Gemmatimonadaceae bacterium]